MGAKGSSGFKVVLWCGEGTATAGTTIGNLQNVSIEGIDRETTEITSTDSTDGWNEYILTGTTEPGTVSCELNYDGKTAGEHSKIMGLLANTATGLVFHVDAPDGSKWATGGVLVSPGTIAFPRAGKNTQTTVRIKASGKPTFTTAA